MNNIIKFPNKLRGLSGQESEFDKLSDFLFDALDCISMRSDVVHSMSHMVLSDTKEGKQLAASLLQGYLTKAWRKYNEE